MPHITLQKCYKTDCSNCNKMNAKEREYIHCIKYDRQIKSYSAMPSRALVSSFTMTSSMGNG